MDIWRLLIGLGLVLLLLGLVGPFLARLGLGRLPGDIIIRRDNFVLYIPLASGLIISVVVSLLWWLLSARP